MKRFYLTKFAFKGEPVTTTDKASREEEFILQTFYSLNEKQGKTASAPVTASTLISDYCTFVSPSTRFQLRNETVYHCSRVNLELKSAHYNLQSTGRVGRVHSAESASSPSHKSSSRAGCRLSHVASLVAPDSDAEAIRLGAQQLRLSLTDSDAPHFVDYSPKHPKLPDHCNDDDSFWLRPRAHTDGSPHTASPFAQHTSLTPSANSHETCASCSIPLMQPLASFSVHEYSPQPTASRTNYLLRPTFIFPEGTLFYCSRCQIFIFFSDD